MKRFLFLLFTATVLIPAVSYKLPTDFRFDGLPPKIAKVKPVHYWFAPLDTINSVTRYYEEDALCLYTRHNPEALIRYLTDSLGKPEYKEHDWVEKDSILGTYSWQLQRAGDKKELRLQLMDENIGIQVYELYLFIYDRNNHNCSTNPEYKAWWMKIIQQKLLQQPADIFPEDGLGQFELCEFMNWNEDSLCNTLKKHLSDPAEDFSIRVSVNKKGAIDQVAVSPQDNALETSIRCLAEDGFPVLIEHQTGDTSKYELQFTLHMPRQGQLEYYAGQLNGLCTDCTDLTDTAMLNALYYEARILRGHLFCATREHALCQLYGIPEVRLYEKVNNRWLFRDSIYSEYTGIFYSWWVEELDGNPFREIALNSGPNSNGNSWKELIRFDTIKNRLYCGGHFNTNYKPDFARKELLTEYGGSWYMPTYHEIQKWVNGNLVAYKKVEIALRETTLQSDESIMTEYENPWWQSGKDTLIPVRHHRYTGTPAQKKIYELFGGRKIYD